jgi:uncharacterized protein (DUF169 family)
MWLYAKVAREGRTVVFSIETYRCAGGAIGLGFGRQIDQHSARTEENFCCFLSNGIEGQRTRRNMPPTQKSRKPEPEENAAGRRTPHEEPNGRQKVP